MFLYVVSQQRLYHMSSNLLHTVTDPSQLSADQSSVTTRLETVYHTPTASLHLSTLTRWCDHADDHALWLLLASVAVSQSHLTFI